MVLAVAKSSGWDPHLVTRDLTIQRVHRRMWKTMQFGKRRLGQNIGPVYLLSVLQVFGPTLDEQTLC